MLVIGVMSPPLDRGATTTMTLPDNLQETQKKKSLRHQPKQSVWREQSLAVF